MIYLKIIIDNKFIFLLNKQIQHKTHLKLHLLEHRKQN